MRTLILCGGEGTRIRDVSPELPKPMLSIGSYPILWHIMSMYARYGYREFVLCLGYKGWAIKEYFLNLALDLSDFQLDLAASAAPRIVSGSAALPDWSVIFAETGGATQTGGRLWRAKGYVDNEPYFAVTYGDGVAELDIADLVAFHQSHGRAATVTGVHPPGRFGVMTTAPDSAGRQIVNDFEEKAQSTSGWINGGFFIFDQRVWEFFSDDPQLILEHEVLMGLAAAGQLVMYEHEGFWHPMDTYRDWRLLNGLWNAGEAKWA